MRDLAGDSGLRHGALVMSDVWHWFPYMTLIILGGLAAIPQETEEAAYIDGATPWQTLLYVVIPQLKGAGGRDRVEDDLRAQDVSTRS